MSEFIKIRHPEIEGEAEVTEDAFDILWGPKGWERIDEPALNLTNEEGAVDNEPVEVEVPAEDLVNQSNQSAGVKDEDEKNASNQSGGSIDAEDPGDLPE